jgi:hypothetical protein
MQPAIFSYKSLRVAILIPAGFSSFAQIPCIYGLPKDGTFFAKMMWQV